MFKLQFSFFLIITTMLICNSGIAQSVIPNGITPNGDGTNETWDLTGLNATSPIKITIFDRWGKQLWQTNDYQNNWSGTDNTNSPLDNGTYYYTLSVGEENRTGWISVIR